MITHGPANLTRDQQHELTGLKAAYRNALTLEVTAVGLANRVEAYLLADACRRELRAFWKRVTP